MNREQREGKKSNGS